MDQEWQASKHPFLGVLGVVEFVNKTLLAMSKNQRLSTACWGLQGRANVPAGLCGCI